MVAPAYRYPDNETVPSYLRGRTAEEAAQMLEGMVQQAGRSMSQLPPQQAAPPPADDDYITAGQQKTLQQQAIAQVQPWLQSVADQQATMTYNIAKRDQPEIFKKYEPEIIQVLNSVPRPNWTLDVVDRAIKLVKGNHVDEIVAEKTRQLESTVFSTMRSTGRAGSGTDFQAKETMAESLEKTPEEWRAHAKAVGITDKELREFCSANDTTPEEFFKQFEKGLVTDAITDVNFVRTRL